MGFWAGILWYDYENTKHPSLLDYATHYTNLLYPLTKLPAYDHDLGFQIYPSYANAYRLTGNEKYRQIALNAADTLATLFNPKVGTLLSWPREVKPNNCDNTCRNHHETPVPPRWRFLPCSYL